MLADPLNPCAGKASEPWTKGWLDAFPCDMPSTVPYPRVPLYTLLEHAARRFPDRAVCTLYGQLTSYGKLADQARRFARALKDRGAGPGKFVGVLLPNVPEYLVAVQAVALTGATLLQLSPLMVHEEVAHWLKATDCRIVLTLDLLAPIVTASLAEGPLEHLILCSLVRRMAMWKGMLYRIQRYRKSGFFKLPRDAHRQRFDELVAGPPLEQPASVDPAEDVAVLAPTGGTTASPKAVMLTHRNLVCNALQLREWCRGADGTTSNLGVLPFFHSYGLTVSMLCGWAQAATIHLHPRFEARAVLNILLTHKPEIVPAVPAMLSALNNVMSGKKYDFSFIQAVISGASALAPEVRQEFESHGAKDVVEGYGLTEASPVTHANPRGANRLGSIGKPLPDTTVRIVDPDTHQDVSGDGVGEIVVRGPQVMKGYYQNPEATAAVLRDGWLYTGDMARRDADGYDFIVDRKKDIIKTSGFLVYPAEVEEVLRSFEGIGEAAVIGVPDLERGELVKALLVPKNGVPINMAALEDFCREHLGKHKRPKVIEVVGELPKNFLGKVLRRKLREAIADAAGVVPIQAAPTTS
jgi:long-chain acyl-CoA synthetase